MEEPIWPEAGGAPGAHTCPALIKIKWMSEGWRAMRQQGGRVTYTGHVCASVSERVWCGLLSVCCSERHTFPVLISPSMQLNQQLLCYSSSGVKSTLTGLPFTSQSATAQRDCIITQNRHKYTQIYSHKYVDTCITVGLLMQKSIVVPFILANGGKVTTLWGNPKLVWEYMYMFGPHKE